MFPRTAVRITHAGRAPVVADPTRVMFYNLGQEYSRDGVSPEGDRCDWFSFRAADVADAIRPFDASVEARVDRPFAATDGPSDAMTYASQRLLFDHVAGGGPVHELMVEEACMLLLDRVVAGAYASRGARVRAPGERAARTHRIVAESVKELVATRFADALRLDDVAAAVGASPFHVARIFRRETGGTIHAHVNALRLRHALERIADGTDLTRLGLDLGYSSHSHFTLAFRRAYGVPPSEMRRSLRARS